MQITIKRLKEIIKEEVDYFNQLLTEQGPPPGSMAGPPPGGPPPGMGAGPGGPPPGATMPPGMGAGPGGPPPGGPAGDPVQGAISALQAGDVQAALQILTQLAGPPGGPPMG